MAVIITGKHNCVIGPHPQKGPLRVWPENGWVCIEDSRDDTYKELKPIEALAHIKGIHDMIGKSSEQTMYKDKIVQYQTFVSRVLTIIRDAKHQANWEDPKCFADARKKAPKSYIMAANIPHRRDF